MNAFNDVFKLCRTRTQYPAACLDAGLLNVCSALRLRGNQKRLRKFPKLPPGGGTASFEKNQSTRRLVVYWELRGRVCAGDNNLVVVVGVSSAC